MRTTAPVGTPVDPAASRVKSDRPGPAPMGPAAGAPPASVGPGLAPSRTVGGHTARLNVGDGESALSIPVTVDVARDPSAPTARAIGGTLRMQTTEGPPKAPQPLPAPAPPPALAPVVSGPADPALGLAWTSPLTVAVGLVFFAVGSMIALAASGRLAGRAPAAPMESSVAASASAVPSVKPTTTPTTPTAAVTAASTSTAAAPNVATTPRPPSGAPRGPVSPQHPAPQHPKSGGSKPPPPLPLPFQ
ncbi:putative Fe-S oxidoreductase [Minicystis rosea]|nr:putative Fe-S oxidoreductase [Minicystis rosea]